MSNPHLPPEILDRVIDFVHDDLETLKQCSLVTKSLVPRARTHLFVYIKFESNDDLEAWKRAFPDRANSPAHHTRCLSLECPDDIPAADMEEGGWIRSFSKLTRLEIEIVSVPCSQVFNLICSLPLLENLLMTIDWVDEDDCDEDAVVKPLTSPPLTGTLVIRLPQGLECCLPQVAMGYVAGQLLDLPGGLHFREFACTWTLKRDIQWTRALMEKCSATLECVDLEWTSPRNYEGEVSFDFSRLKKLRQVVFRFHRHYPTWITMALKTITPEHRDLRISLHIPMYPGDVAYSAEDEIGRQWVDLDRSLIRVWESHGVRTRVVYNSGKEGEQGHEYIAGLLPEVTGRGIAELVDDC